MQRKYFILFLAVVILGSTSFFIFSQSNSENIQTSPEEVRVAPASTQTATASIPATSSLKTLAPIKGPTVSLIVEGNSYEMPFVKGQIVLETMRAVSLTNNFSFSGKEYPSLGFFVEEMNGKKNENGYYWFLYMNDKESLTGASETSLKPGDIVEWRYKKSY